MIKLSQIIFFCTVWCMSAKGQQLLSLYSKTVPNSWGAGEDVSNAANTSFTKVANPGLYVYLPAEGKGKRTAVIICPGGGYGQLVIKREGHQVAENFNKKGIAAFVLKYRLPDDNTNKNKTIAPLQDAQQAIKTVRDSAEKWNIDADKIGIMGFSAGGHLASSAGTHFKDVMIPNATGSNVRPNFMILVYPVISFNSAIAHLGSRNNLLGANPPVDSIRYFSNELHVDKETPPTFLVHAGDDKVVNVANSIRFYEALNKNGVPSDLHIYTKGGHGFGSTPIFDEWFGRCLHWMKSNEFIAR